MMKYLFCALMSPILAGSTYLGQVSRTEMLKRSNVVFTGTVTKLGAVSFAGVPTSPKTMVVRVDNILDKPAAISIPKGGSVTVEARNPSDFREGLQATFYTETWIFGAGLALREVGHELMTPQTKSSTPTPQKPEEIAQARQALNEAELRSRVQAADIVIVGQVQEVRQPSVTTRGATRPQVREHDPDWREAVVRVETAIKGAQANQNIVIKFPASVDVAWYQMPKFQQGQTGTFVLKRDQTSGAPRAMLAGRQVNTYTALSSNDVLPANAAERIRALLR